MSAPAVSRGGMPPQHHSSEPGAGLSGGQPAVGNRNQGQPSTPAGSLAPDSLYYSVPLHSSLSTAPSLPLQSMNPGAAPEHFRHTLATPGAPHPSGTRLPTSTKTDVPISPPVEVTPQGEKYPLDLKPFLTQGVPLRIAQAVSDTDLRFYAARFPSTFDLPSLAQPIAVSRDVSQLELGGNSTETSGPERISGGITSTHEHSHKRISVDRLPWRLVDAASRNLVGRRMDLDVSTYFVMVDKGTTMDIVPVDAWYSFQADIALRQEGPTSSDVAERKRRAAIRQEEKAEELLRKRLERKGIDQDDADSVMDKAGDAASYSKAGELEYLYSEDAGLQRQQRKRFKQFIKSKRKGIRREDEDTGQSALNVGQIKRAAVDWDWDDDGKATDDEEDTGLADDALEASEMQRADYHESDDDEEEVLTKCGQQVHSALESQREQDAEDELAQFSDDEEEDMDEPKKQDTTSERKGDSSEKATDGSSSVAVDSTAGPPRDDGGGRTAQAPGDSGKPGQTSASLSSAKDVGETSAALSPSSRRHDKGDQAGPKSSSSRSGAASDGAKKPSGDVQRLTPEIVRQRVIRTLSLHGGRMPTKKFIQSFNITSNKSELFKLIRKTINEICEVRSEYENGETVKVLELQAQFRHT